MARGVAGQPSAGHVAGASNGARRSSRLRRWWRNPFAVGSALFVVVIVSAAVCAPLNPAYTQSEFEAYCKNLNIKAAIVAPGQTRAPGVTQAPGEARAGGEARAAGEAGGRVELGELMLADTGHRECAVVSSHRYARNRD